MCAAGNKVTPVWLEIGGDSNSQSLARKSILLAGPQPARALFCADGFNDQWSSAFGGKRRLGFGDGGANQGFDCGFGQGSCAFQADKTDLIATALQDARWVGQASAVVKKESNAVGVGGHRNDAIGGSGSGAEADDEEIVVVVDQFERGGKPPAERGADGPNVAGNFRIEFSEKSGELLGRGWNGSFSGAIGHGDFLPG